MIDIRDHGIGAGGKKATGTAQPIHVRAGETFSNAEGTDKVGTLQVRATAPLVVTAVTEDVILAPGIYDEIITVKGDPDKVSGNIRAGVDIDGVAGKDEVVDTTTSSGAIASHVIAGKEVFVNGNKVIGTIPLRRGQIAATGVDGGTPGKLLLRPSYGEWDGTDAWVVANEANFTPGNIKKGVPMFGQTGSLTPGIKLPAYTESGNGAFFYAAGISSKGYQYTEKPTPDGYVTRIYSDGTKLIIEKYNSLTWALVSSVNGASIDYQCYIDAFDDYFIVVGVVSGTTAPFVAKKYNYSGSLLQTYANTWGIQAGGTPYNYSGSYNPTRNIWAYGVGSGLRVVDSGGTIIVTATSPNSNLTGVVWLDVDRLFAFESTRHILLYKYGASTLTVVAGNETGSSFGTLENWIVFMLKALGFTK